MVSVYLASRFQDRPKIQYIKRDLEEAGIYVTSRWLLPGDEVDITKIPGMEKECAEMACRDYEDIDDGDIFVIFSQEQAHGNGTGGRHVEFGYARAKGKSIILIGKPENIFHHEGVSMVLDDEMDLANKIKELYERVFLAR